MDRNSSQRRHKSSSPGSPLKTGNKIARATIRAWPVESVQRGGIVDLKARTTAGVVELAVCSHIPYHRSRLRHGGRSAPHCPPQEIGAQ